MAKLDKYDDLINNVIEQVGGKDNISEFVHCVTRLRFNVKDKSKVQFDTIKKNKSILGVQWSGEQLQIIIGQEVGDVYDAICTKNGIKAEAAVDENLDPSIAHQKFSWKQLPKRVLDTISAIIFPVIPIYLGAGLVLLLINILGPSILNVISTDSNLYVFLNIAGQAGYYFMPIFIAWSAAKHFKTSIPIAMFLCSIMIYPDLITMVTEGTSMTVYGIPMTMVNYSRQILPSILTVWILSYIYRFIDGHMPNSLKYAFNPLCTILIMLPIEFCVLGPIGTYVGDAIAAVCVWISSTIGPLAIGIIGGLWYILVGLGMDKALSPVITNNFSIYGYDNLFWMSAVSATYALMGVGLAYAIKCKKEERSGAVSAFITLSVGGVSEPTIFGTLFRYRKSIGAYFAGGFVGGFLSGLFGLKAYTFGTGNALFFTVCAAPGVSLIPAIIACAAAFAVSFVLAMIVGFKDDTSKEAV